ncbi:synaptonemal complex protein 2-like, partial [Hyperolius riggenbachi]|uniref:synaptonemal complex protein 2-like n=1 Tax=Hyperolius riggenbachi TaxID=752182 RepID=UPI0035A30774
TPFNYEYPESTPSGTDIELMQVDSIKSPGSSTKRGKPACPPRRPVTRASLSETKKPVSHRALCSSESGVDSGKSWVLESKKPTPMSADYSRKKSKPRSRLRVLPLSSESSDENVNHNK